MLRSAVIATLFLLSVCSTNADADDQPKTLPARIAEWRYPDSTLNNSTMGDGATVDENGNRTVPSVHCKAVLATDDPIDKVLDYYKTKLTKRHGSHSATKKNRAEITTGRSVAFHSDVVDRLVAIHIISINHGNVSTTLVISRAKSESKTHIAWSQYERVPLPKQAG